MFKSEFVDVVFDDDSRDAVWRFGGRNVRGVEYIYSVVDRNYLRRNKWSFRVRVPKISNGYLGVQPTVVPNRKIWAGLERRSLEFGLAKLGKYRSRAGSDQGKLLISQPTVA